MNKILIAEDEEAIREFVVINLQRSGYSVIEACNGEDAINKYYQYNDFDVIILDIMMPFVDGLEVCRQIRKNDPMVGIIMLTAKSQDADKVSALAIGADDYITKPFSPAELVARVATLNRRVEMLQKSKVLNKDESEQSEKTFVLNMRKRTLTRDGKEFDLTPVEFQLLEILFAAEGDTVDRNYILRRVWGDSFLGEEKIVDVNIRRLRMKIEDEPSSPQHIITVRGIGYRWKD